MAGDRFGCGILFETLLKDSLDAVNVEEFETQGPLTGGIEPGSAVPFGQAEQLLGRTKPAPGKLAGEQLIREVARRRSQIARPLAIEVGPAHRVGRLPFGIIVVIGGADAASLALVR